MNRIFLYTLVLMLALTPLVAANTPPQPPHRFFGDITINGQDAPIGTQITARVGGTSYGSGIVQTAGQYGYDPIFYVEAADETDFSGRTIAFYVNGEFASSYAPYEHGQSTLLNLSITREEETNTGGSSSGGSSGGGGGGGGASSISTTSTTQQENQTQENATQESTQTQNGETISAVCTSDWVCSEWTECVNGFQNRRCVDVNQCGNTEDRPAQQQTCESEPEPQQEAWYSNLFTGAFIGAEGAGAWIWAGIALLVIAGLLGAGLYAKKKNQKK